MSITTKNCRGGIIYISVNGNRYDAKGNFSYNLGGVKRETIIGADGIHGFASKPQEPSIEGEITDSYDLDVKALLNLTDCTVTLELANGKTIVLSHAWYAGEGKIQSEEGNIEVKFIGKQCEEIK